MNGEEGKPYVPIGGPLNVCHTCPQCYGFGVEARKFNGDYLPISAEDAIKGPTPEWRPCPNCRSTPSGTPTA